MKKFLLLLITLTCFTKIYTMDKKNQELSMQAETFKKYDIRGIVNKDLIIEDTYKVAQAIAHHFKQKNPNVTDLVVGMDGRIHSPAIKEQICNGLRDSGINVTFIGVCSTPIFYFANETLDADGGIMITASHNPKIYNGLKITFNKKSVFDAEIQAIKDLFFNGTFSKTLMRGSYNEKSVTDAYIQMLVNNFSHLKNKPINAIIDCAHGATAVVIPELVKQMNWENVKLMYATIDGAFPAHEADPTKPENTKELRQRIKEHNINIGISFDGDGDRMCALTENGTMMSGDELTTIFCEAIKKEVGPFNLVSDIKCASALLKKLKELDLTCTLTPCGIGFVREAMRKTHALFGGELSCHFCFNDRYFGYDDGVYAMMRLFELLDKQQTKLSTLYNQLPQRFCSPELRLESSHDKKWTIVKEIKNKLAQRDDIKLTTIDGIRAETSYGCATLRASNTEPVISTRFEGSNPSNLNKIISEFYDLLVPYFDESYITNKLSE